MLNEERIRLMTKLTIYEEGEGKKIIPMSHFYRSDFISRAIMKSFIIGTMLYGIFLGLWFVYQMENLKGILIGSNIKIVIFQGVIGYICFLGIYLMITYLVASVTYSRGKKSLKKYQSILKKVEKMHDREGKLQPPLF